MIEVLALPTPPAIIAIMKYKLATVAAIIAALMIPHIATSLTSPVATQDEQPEAFEPDVIIDEPEPIATSTAQFEPPQSPVPISDFVETVIAKITGFNSLEAQTDSTPCIAAGGNICGRTDATSCPRRIPLHTWVTIGGKSYECMDRTHPRFDNRFDISCDKDMDCPFEVHRESATVLIHW